MEYCAISRDEAAPCVLWYLFGSAGVVQDDLRKHTVSPAAYPEIHVVLDLTWDDIGVGSLCGEYQMDMPGGSGATGYADLLTRDADGYTMLSCTSTIVALKQMGSLDIDFYDFSIIAGFNQEVFS